MTTLPVAGYISNAARTVAEVKQALEDVIAFERQSAGGDALGSALGIVSGAVTPTKGIHSVETESLAATDDLDVINTTNLPDGSLLILRTTNSSRDVQIRHNNNGAGGAGAVQLCDAANFTLLDTTMWIMLRRNNTQWEEVFRFYGAQKAAARTFVGSGAPVPTPSAASDWGKFVQVDQAGAGVELAGPLRFMRNRIVNGDMRLSQRAAGSSQINNTTSIILHSPDRWYGSGESADGVFNTQRANDSLPTNDQYTFAMKATVTTADASIGASQRYIIGHRIEGTHVQDFLWGTSNARPVVLSFWVKSSVTGTFSGALRNNGATRSYPFTFVVSTTNWERKEVAIPGDTSGTWLVTTGLGIELIFDLGAGTSVRGTAGSWAGSAFVGATGATSLISTISATYYITGVQLELGTKATPFDFRSMHQETLLCQRYYWKTYDIDVALQTVTDTGCMMYAVPSTAAGWAMTVQYPVEMRGAPTVQFFNPVTGASGSWRQSTNNINMAVHTSAPQGTRGMSINNTGVLGASDNIRGHISCDAEL
jgi:hypothetical protein